MRKAVLLCLVCLFFGVNSKADERSDRDRAIDAGLKSAKASLSEMSSFDAHPAYQFVLNALVGHAISELRDKGFEKEADRYEKEWNTRFSAYLTQPGTLYLGEHSPISKWLAAFYSDLTDRIGMTATRALNLDDIFTFNFGIPVVFHPNGYDGQSWDKTEYGLHFVPVTGAVTYWVTREACTASLHGIVAWFCGEAAGLVRGVVEREIAPKLSDFVYDTAHGKSVERPQYDFDELTKDARK